MKRVRAVTLDAGGTLLEPWPSVGHVYASVAREWGAPELDPARLTAAFGRAWKARREFDYSRAAWREVVTATFAEASGFAVEAGCFDAIYARFACADAWRVYPDVAPLLEGLRARGVEMAVVSNWDERLHPLLEALGLRVGMRAVLTSLEVGHHKPAPEIFARAAALFELAPAEILHVGDSEREDFHGARAAGFQAVRVERRPGSEAGAGTGSAPTPAGDRTTVASLLDVLAVVDA
jgi:putative hydrolase of the HAD superfamily